MGGDRAQAVKEETAKLLQAGFIREIKYSTWLANVVMVKKANKKWRMCTDYTDLNKACPKDAYPLPHIDTLVDGAASHQRLRTCMEIYVDDMVIKSVSASNHLEDLMAVFDEVRRYHMRLNPAKCTFGVAGRKFLGFMLSKRGIEANPDKCQAIVNMRSPCNVKEVQRLAGRIASLARFLPCMAEKSRPIMTLLKKARKFQWTEECEASFQKLQSNTHSTAFARETQLPVRHDHIPFCIRQSYQRSPSATTN
uniref:Transposon Ty3-I Gag-Pol polyprotein n=1 Tax=Cajanus cajan TaxID=3821 RepID=A0A151S654_CAJCA|nr:Transposon Ty3-I Gag-Pol polyprotein [Cajanus cajan]